MIMFCMNCVSAGECGGNVARVDEGSSRVGWPGAPGWTTTGVCCAASGRANKHTSAKAGRYLITGRYSPHSLTEALRSSSVGQFIPQVAGILHGGSGSFTCEVQGIIKLLREIPAAPSRICSIQQQTFGGSDWIERDSFVVFEF